MRDPIGMQVSTATEDAETVYLQHRDEKMAGISDTVLVQKQMSGGHLLQISQSTPHSHSAEKSELSRSRHKLENEIYETEAHARIRAVRLVMVHWFMTYILGNRNVE